MACSTCYTSDSGIIYDNPSILGRNITGRSTAGYDLRPPNVQPGVIINGNLYQDEEYPDNPGSFNNPGNNPVTVVTPTVHRKTLNWGSFFVGLIIGGAVTMFLVTRTGRDILGAAGQRTVRYMR